MKSFLAIVFVLLNCGHGNCLNSKFNKEYFKMPKLFHYDDYDQCLGLYDNEAFYCVVNTFIKPDEKSELSKFITEFSSNKKQHFRHDKLQRGLCLNGCKDVIDKMGKGSEKYLVEKFPFDSKVRIFNEWKNEKVNWLNFSVEFRLRALLQCRWSSREVWRWR